MYYPITIGLAQGKISNIEKMNIQKRKSEITKKQLIIGLLIGFIVTFSTYSALYVFREAFRYLSITNDFDLWILSDKAVNFYNLIFGFIAVIFGQSAFLSFIFAHPKKIFERKHYLKASIVNDQQYLNISFIYWFLNLLFFFFMFFGNTIQGGFYVLDFYPKYNYVFILLVIVLFLQTWTTIRRKYKNSSIKYFLISALSLSILAFGLSRINLIDYNAINEICLRKNIVHSYQIDLPKSVWTEKWRDNRNEKRIYVASENSKPIFIIDNKQVELDSLIYVSSDWKDEYEDAGIAFVKCKLYISQEQKMSVVNELKSELSKCGIRRITYAVIPAETEYDNRYYRDSEIRTLIPPYRSKTDLIEDYNKSHLFENIIEIESREGNLSLNGKLSFTGEFELQIKESIKGNSDYIFKHRIKNNCKYSEYIRIYSLLRKIIVELREEYAMCKYGDELDYLDYEPMKEVYEKYPLRLIEVTEELYNLVD